MSCLDVVIISQKLVDLQRQAAGRVTDVIGMGAAMFAGSTPDMLDALGGNRGSSLALAEYAFRGGQHRIDPLTGETGMSGESIKKLVNEVRTTMYDRDQAGALTRNVGFTMGEQGQVFADLQRRGMIAGPASSLQAMVGDDGYPGRPRYSGESDAAYQRGVRRQNKTITDAIQRQYAGENVAVPRSEDGGIDLEAVQRDRPMLERVMNDAEMQTVSQEFDSRKVISALESYGGAIKAMREIFGDSGNPNAPIPELVNALNALTGNALAQTDPSKVEQMVRTTYALAEQTGVGLPGMMMMSQEAAAQAQALGINPLFANEGVRGALAFRQVTQGRGLGGYAAWGRGDIEDFTRQDQALQLNAAGSAAANRMGAAYRIREALAGAGEETPFAADSGVERWLSAVQAGQRSVSLDFGDGRGERRVGSQLNDSQFFNLMRSSAEQSGVSLSDATVAEMMGQRQQNQRLIFEQGLTPLVRGLQVNDAVTRAAVAGQWAAGTRVDELGLVDAQGQPLGREDIGQLVSGLSGAVAASLVELDPEVATDPGRLRRHLARQMKRRLETAAADTRHPMYAAADQVMQRFAGNDAGLDRWLSGTAESMQGTIDQGIRDQGFYGGIQDLAVMQNTNNLADAARNTFRARTQGEIASAMAPFGAGGPLRSAMESVMSGPERGGTDLVDVLSSMVGGKRADAMSEDMLPILEGLRAQREELDEAMEDWENSDGASREDRARAVEAKTAALQTETEALASYLQQAGISLDAPVGGTEMNQALGRQQWSAKRLAELREGGADLDLTEFVDAGTQEKAEQAAGKMGTNAGALMAMARDEFDTMMKDSNAISKEQAAVLTRARDEVDTQMTEALEVENEQSAEFAHRLLADDATMRAGGVGLRAGVANTLAAYEEMQLLSGQAGGLLAASQGEDTRVAFRRAKDRLNKGTQQMEEFGFRAGYGFMSDAQKSQLSKVAGKLSDASELVRGEADVMLMDREDLAAFVQSGDITADEFNQMVGLRNSAKDENRAIKRARQAHTASASQTMADSLEKLTGREATEGTIESEIERTGMEAWLTAISAAGPDAAVARNRLKSRAGTVDTLRGIQKRLGKEGSLEDMIFNEDKTARDEPWLRTDGLLSNDEMVAVREAQGWRGKEKGWLRMGDDAAVGDRRTGVGDLVPTAANQPQTGTADADGSASISLKIDRLVINGEDMGRATGEGEGGRDGDANSAETA